MAPAFPIRAAGLTCGRAFTIVTANQVRSADRLNTKKPPRGVCNLMRRVRNSNVFQALAEFRYLIRCYLNHAAKAAESVGLEPQQYVALLQLRGMPEGEEPTIRSLADRLQVRHNTATELINRMERRGLLRRERSNSDRRRVLLRTTTRGERLLGRLVRHRIAELRTTAPDLVKSLRNVLAARALSPKDHRRGAEENSAQP